MSPKFKNFILSIPILILSVMLFSYKSKSDFIKELKLKLSQFTNSIPTEKVYLHTDKPMYFPGEDIWFSAYVVSESNEFSQISDLVYVELIDPRNNILEKLTLASQNGYSYGDFHLDDHIPGGRYKLRAYTLWMRNFDDDALFEKEINIQNVIPPNLLLKLDFEKENYSPGETVIANFESRDLEDQPITQTDISCQIMYNGKLSATSHSVTDEIGEAQIAFDLPDSLSSRDGLINIIISYKGQSESISRAIPIAMQSLALSFYPEGGHIILGRQNTLAFEALNEFGKPVDIKGELYSNKHELISSFESYHMGMGKVVIPSADNGYYVKVINPTLRSPVFQLPDPISSGYLLHLSETTEKKLKFQVGVPEHLTGYLTGHIHDRIAFSEKINGTKRLSDVEIDYSEFPSGIMVFTLFDHEGIEVCERLVFINQKHMNIEVSADKKRYLNREKVRLDIKTTDKNSNPVSARLSLAVVDDRIITFADDKQDNLLSSLLLNSELKGHIKEPSFYFDETESKAKEALDLLMMTHGWRRFTWQQVFDPIPPVTYAPENFSVITGIVMNTKTKKPVKTPVYLLEMDKQNRIGMVHTDRNGTFRFYDANPTASMEIIAMSTLKKEKNWKIILNSMIPLSSGTIETCQDGFELKEKFEYMPGQVQQPIEEEIDDNKGLMAYGTSVSLTPDITALSEVIVVGYGSVQKHNLTGSISTLNASALSPIPEIPVEQVLNGRVSGVTVVQNGAPGADLSVRIRGFNTLANQDPLYVIDGNIVDLSDGDQSTLRNFVSPDNIDHITVIKSPETTSLFGSRAANGVVAITTKRGSSYLGDGYFSANKNYANLYVNNLKRCSAVREFYVPNYENKLTNQTDLRQTIYWNPDIKTDSAGNAAVEFFTSDAMTAFRITAEGIGHEGLPGRCEQTFGVGDPLNIDIKLPAYVVKGDTLKIPIQIFNTSNETISGKLVISTEHITIEALGDQFIMEIPPKSSITQKITCLVKNPTPTTVVKVRFFNNEIDKKTEKSIQIYPRGFPVEISLSDAAMQKSFSFNLEDVEPGSMQSEFIAYTDQIGELFDGIESMLRQPHGCFEQVSSSTYPNILVLQLLKELNLNNPEIEKKALEYISTGYNMLTKYEVEGGGFEWFGHEPAHEGLTAYGLMEFVEMRKVYPKVSDRLIDRTKSWLLDRRDGKGGFKFSSAGYDHFSGGTKNVTNAYLVYALASSGEKGIMKEYQTAFGEALNSKDAYRLALMLNAAYELERREDYDQIAQLIQQNISEYGIDGLKAEYSIVRSYGTSLQNEIAALTLLGLMKTSKINHVQLIKDLFSYMVGKRSYGGFGSTQATVLGLQASTQYASKYNRAKEDGEIHIIINNAVASQKQFYKDHDKDILFENFSGLFTNGRQKVDIHFLECKNPLSYSMNLNWITYKPVSDSRCPIDIKVKYARNSVKINETVRLEINVNNQQNKAQPMTMATVGIPGGLGLQPWQLKQLLDERIIDFYEIIDGYLVLYFTTMNPLEEKKILLDLKAELPGSFNSQAHSAYLYYMHEAKKWELGDIIIISD